MTGINYYIDKAPGVAQVKLLSSGIKLIYSCDDLTLLTPSLYQQHRQDFQRKLAAMEQGIDMLRRRPQS